MNPEAFERIRITAEDLLFLRREWDQDVSDASLRRSSPILRRLLVESSLQRAWRDLGLDRQPAIRATSLEVKIRNFVLQKISFAQAGGAKHCGVVVDTLIEYGCYLPPEQASKVFGSDEPVRDFSLRKFAEGACMVVKGEVISRNTLVKYVANKLGGVHFDMSRGNGKEEESKFRLLDEVRAERTTMDKPAIYFEYLAIGQAVINSPDIVSFVDMASKAVVE
jgi:hypothetical protein